MKTTWKRLLGGLFLTAWGIIPAVIGMQAIITKHSQIASRGDHGHSEQFGASAVAVGIGALVLAFVLISLGLFVALYPGDRFVTLVDKAAKFFEKYNKD